MTKITSKKGTIETTQPLYCGYWGELKGNESRQHHREKNSGLMGGKN